MNSIESYMKWQPKYAAYDKWPKLESDDYSPVEQDRRKLQAIMEMVGEAGEVLQVATKARRKGTNIPREKVVDELGDTFWGLVGVMNEFDITFEEMIQLNMDKLNERNK